MKLLNYLAAVAVLASVGCRSATIEVPGYATVRGLSDTSYHFKQPYFKFRGLFYGQEPTNLTRFLPPVPFRPVPDVIYDATNVPDLCTQAIGSEDCLAVNVHTRRLPGSASDPNTSYDDLLPVIFWIHGGSFSSGGNLLYGGDKYMDQDVVLVEVQYRLGPLGFLSLNTDEIPGNAGIFDQIEALRWTNQFIKYFGGDPNCVTIVGESAGSASVGLLLLAPQARGLFHRVIGQSGAMLTSWALDPEPVKHGLRIAELAGCPLEQYSDLLYCLRNIDDGELKRAFTLYQLEDRKNGGLGFGGSSPVVQVAGAERLLTEDPRKLMETGQYDTEVPILFGGNKQEGVLVLAYLYNEFLVPNNLLENSTYLANDLVPLILSALGVADPDGEIALSMTEKYLGYAEMGNFQSMIPGLTDLCSVLFLKEGGYQTVQIHSRFNPNAYWYSFNYEGRFSLYTVLFFPNLPPIPHGVCHADELIYLFAFPTYGNNFTEAIVSQRMLQVWTTFAKYGNPTPDGVDLIEGIPKFLPYTDQDLSYMAIDRDWTLKRDYTLTYTVTVDEMR